MDFTAIKLLILDVDGVLTDGGVMVGPEGELIKKFHVRDGHAVKLWQRCGHRAAILSGRESGSVTRRARELGIEIVKQGMEDKLSGYEEILSLTGLKDADVAFVGDDLPDLPVMRRCGLGIAVADAAARVRRAASYVTRISGGRGAAAEVVELILRKQGRWSEVVGAL